MQPVRFNSFGGSICTPHRSRVRCGIARGQNMSTARTSLSAVAGIVLTALAGCSTDAYIAAPQPTASEITAAVAGLAASTINAEGKFALQPPPVTLAPQVSAAHAGVLALLWTKEFGPYFRDLLEGTHGGPIRLDRLAPCGRPLYAASAFEEPPLEMLPALRRGLGPLWLITLCEGSTPKVSVSVSAWATELTIVNGLLKFPVNSGGEFYGHGIPLGHSGEYPVSPERAAVSTSRQVGRRVTSVPYLIAGFNKFGHPGYARWQWKLESNVSVQTQTGRRLFPEEVFAGEAVPVSAGEILYVPAEIQPDTLQVKSPPPLIFLEPRESYEERVRTQTRVFTVKRRAGIPALFDRVATVEKQP